ncbi:hypothetical protein EEB14_20870 [Rhodococcus sp. WS4]|nr:hypothetical protein EEB14_20870 [Rhodococcus sp. WS4]
MSDRPPIMDEITSWRGDFISLRKRHCTLSKKPRRKSQNRPTKPARVERNTITHPQNMGSVTSLTILYEHLQPGVVAAFKAPSEMGYDRLRQIKRTMKRVLPNTVTTRIRLAGSMSDSVDAILRERDVEHDAAYTTERGANVAVAKTMAAPDGTFDIVVDASLFFNFETDTAEERREQTRQVLHLAAHEPQHVLLHLSRTDSHYYKDDVTCTRTPRAYRSPLAEAIDEFRCELAANRIAPSAQSRESVFAEDLAHIVARH